MKIAVIGKSGQLALELQKLSGVTAFGRDDIDLIDVAACRRFVRNLQCDAMINAAAYTAVDKAEDDPSAFIINGEAPAAMAVEAANRKIPFVHVSTDYVFKGTGKANWHPRDKPDPVNAYGRSKLIGENGIRAAGGTHAIIRTSWVFSAHGNNFVKTMLRLSETRPEISVVDDQTGGPTPASALAEVCMAVATSLAHDATLSGTFHFAGVPDVTWAAFGREIFEQAGKDVEVKGISSAQYATKAKRPLNSRLDCTSFEAAFGFTRPDWKKGLNDVLHELGALS